MELIAHRFNKLKNLKKLSSIYGVEIDLRSKGSKIILNHDPFENGDRFDDFLENYNNGTLILNIKESGLEMDAINTVKKHKIKKFFLLDVEMPFICNNNKKVNKNISIRFSEYESIQTVKNFINNVGWVWIDTFKTLPLDQKTNRVLKKFKNCLVCPERWSRPNDISNYYSKMKRLNFSPDAIMTSYKYFKIWEKLFK